MRADVCDGSANEGSNSEPRASDPDDDAPPELFVRAHRQRTPRSPANGTATEAEASIGARRQETVPARRVVTAHATPATSIERESASMPKPLPEMVSSEPPATEPRLCTDSSNAKCQHEQGWTFEEAALQATA